MANYNYNPDVDKPIFDVDGNKLTSIPHSPKKLIYNADGLKLSKVTLNIPQKSGFATKENAKRINRIGRPKGSRTKTKNTLLDAISRFENYQLDAAELIVAVMMGDEAKAGGEIRVADRVGAAKYVIEAPRKMDKPNTEDKSDTITEDEDEVIKPLISLTVSDR